MTDSDPTDDIAREAARLIALGKASDVADAVRTAAHALRLETVRLPRAGLVRRHVQGMSMQGLGAEAYHLTVSDVLAVAEEIMAAVEHTIPDGEPALVGRAAKGLVDAGATFHIHVHTRDPIAAVADALVDCDYEEPRFETADTRFGRLDRIRFEEAGHTVVITRCLPEMKRGVDLFNRKPIESITRAALRRRLGLDEER